MMPQAFRHFIATIGATRYLISLIVMLIVLGYALLTFFDYVPFYAELASQLYLSSRVLLVLLYLSVTILVTLIWYQWVIRPEQPTYNQHALRSLYRLSDQTGLIWYDILLLAVLLASYFAAPRLLTDIHLRETARFLTFVIAIPILIGLLPTQRPRRVVVPPGRTLRQIAQNLAVGENQVEEVMRRLTTYNELNLLLPDNNENQLDQELPVGMVIEIPPRF